MVQHTTAVFENGSLRPLIPLVGIPEHAILDVTVEQLKPHSVEEQLAMLLDVPVAEELAAAIEQGRAEHWRPSEF